MPVCASGDRRRNVACVFDCAEVRGLPARQIKSGWFPADGQQLRGLSVSLNLHDINKSSGRTAHRRARARLPARVLTHGHFPAPFQVQTDVKQGAVLSTILFSIYIDELLLKLESSGLGCYVGHVFVGIVDVLTI